jgi:large subunit ribosomal protein L1
MAKMTRHRKIIEEKVDYERAYPIAEAVALLNEISGSKFNESLDISVNLGIDPKKSDQTVRGATSLPHGSGKEIRVAVFAQGANADEAQEAGADIVGF